MIEYRDTGWQYWAVTAALLGVGLFTGLPGVEAAAGLCAIQTLHYAALERRVTAFPVQVRLAYLALLLAGFWSPLAWVHWVQLVGTTARVTVGYCLLARIMSLMPWNRREPLSRALVTRTFVSAPVPGNMLQGL